MRVFIRLDWAGDFIMKLILQAAEQLDFSDYELSSAGIPVS
jgi:hypothetical protein